MSASALPGDARWGKGTAAGEKPQVLLLFPGPAFDLAEQFAERLGGMSEDFRGSVLLTGPKQQVVQLGRFEVTMLDQRSQSKIGAFGRFLRTALRIARERQSRSDPFDLVASYDPVKTGLVGWRVARDQDVPLIVEVNGDLTLPVTYSDISNPIVRHVKRRSYVLVERFILGRANGIKLLHRALIEPFRGLLRDPVLRTFPPWVDLRFFRDLGETPEVLFVGFPYRLKGVDLLINAFKAVSDDFPEWRLKILGWFPDPTELKAAIGGHPRILSHPPVGRRDVGVHIGRCGVFVLPSRTEAMGRVLIEAMACGKARIGAAVGGIPMVIRDEEDGLLFRPEDAGHLAAQLRRVMGDPELRRRLGKRAASRAQEEFSSEAYFGHLRDFYMTVLERTRESRSRGAGPGRP